MSFASLDCSAIFQKSNLSCTIDQFGRVPCLCFSKKSEYNLPIALAVFATVKLNDGDGHTRTDFYLEFVVEGGTKVRVNIKGCNWVSGGSLMWSLLIAVFITVKKDHAIQFVESGGWILSLQFFPGTDRNLSVMKSSLAIPGPPLAICNPKVVSISGVIDSLTSGYCVVNI